VRHPEPVRARPASPSLHREGKVAGTLVAFAAAVCLPAGCTGLGESVAWHERCPPAAYAAASLDQWFRPTWEVTDGPRGPQVEGYIYNDSRMGTAIRMLLAIERLDPAGQPVQCAQVWVSGTVPQDDRAYFAALVPDAGARYRVRILSFDWDKRGGS
jgi:hypothetical protein